MDPAASSTAVALAAGMEWMVQVSAYHGTTLELSISIGTYTVYPA